MANIKLLQEAIQAFANGDSKVADSKMRKYFVEQAQEINKKLEEEMETEEDLQEEEDLDEAIDTAPESDLTGEVEYALDEGLFDDGRADDDWEAYPEEQHQKPVEEAEDEVVGVEDEFSSEEQPQESAGWEDFKAAFQDLERIFDEINGEDAEEHEDGLELDVDVSDDVGAGEEEEEDFSDVDFGDEKVGESYKMKPVSAPSNDSAKSKSPVAKNAKSPVDGVKPVTIKDGSVQVTGVGEKGGDAESYTTDDNNNVMDNAKNMMKTVSEPKNTAEKSRSPLPKSAPKM